MRTSLRARISDKEPEEKTTLHKSCKESGSGLAQVQDRTRKCIETSTGTRKSTVQVQVRYRSRFRHRKSQVPGLQQESVITTPGPGNIET